MRVAVIGGGVVGVCTAYFLAETGHEVTVLERYGNVAQESSFGNLDLMGPASVRPWSMPGTVRRVLGMLMRPESPMVFSAFNASNKTNFVFIVSRATAMS